MNPGTVFLKCDISLGPFSKERVFELATASGKKYSGIAPVGYCYNSAGAPYHVNEPESPEPGRLQAKLIRNGTDTALVAVPDGESIDVPSSLIVA